MRTIHGRKIMYSWQAWHVIMMHEEVHAREYMHGYHLTAMQWHVIECVQWNSGIITRWAHFVYKLSVLNTLFECMAIIHSGGSNNGTIVLLVYVIHLYEYCHAYTCNDVLEVLIGTLSSITLEMLGVRALVGFVRRFTMLTWVGTWWNMPCMSGVEFRWG